MLYDISPPIEPGLAVWPGDPPFRSHRVASIERGESTNIGAIESTVHLGSHVDAPFHTEADGAPVDALPVDRFWGPCWVVEVFGREEIGSGDIDGIDWRAAPRVLFKTLTAEARDRFPERCAALTVPLIEELARAGVVLVGIDTPSVDRLDSSTLDVHHALNRHGISNLEGLVLSEVPAGRYELAALPLKLVGLDASPVRAVLRTFPG